MLYFVYLSLFCTVSLRVLSLYIQHWHIRPKRKFCRNSFMKSSDILYLSLLVYTFVCLACYQHTKLLNKLYYDNREQNAYPHNIVIETLITE